MKRAKARKHPKLPGIPIPMKRIEPRFSWMPIIYCICLNIAAAAVVFLLSLFITGNPRLTVINTFYTWLVTATTSFGFWIWWFFEKMKTDQKTKVVFVFSMLFLLAMEWVIVLSCLWYLI